MAGRGIFKNSGMYEGMYISLFLWDSGIGVAENEPRSQVEIEKIEAGEKALIVNRTVIGPSL